MKQRLLFSSLAWDEKKKKNQRRIKCKAFFLYISALLFPLWHANHKCENKISPAIESVISALTLPLLEHDSHFYSTPNKNRK
jgi:hypothetical protein